MRVQCLQQVDFEGPEIIREWASSKGFEFDLVHSQKEQDYLFCHDYDLLVVMGGPMGLRDIDSNCWLAQELNYIKEAIKLNKKILGVCLGAQLIAYALGAQISSNKNKEIGWFEITLNECSKLPLSDLTVYHWHSDIFPLPENAVSIAKSEACDNQGFVYQDRVFALQFHMEVTARSVTRLLKYCGDELDGSRYCQTEARIESGAKYIPSAHSSMHKLLSYIEKV